MPSNHPQTAIKDALSASRVGTYESATSAVPNLDGALALYLWNAQVSAAFMPPLHICEVVVRNAVADALQTVYGHQWPWDPTFEQSLPNPPKGKGYNARRDLIATRMKEATTGKVIPELKFVFWQKMFTGRFDGRLWNTHMRAVLPHLDQVMTVQQLRRLIHDELEQLRSLRNRIAHHEPIFRRNLASDFQRAHDLIAFRCPHTAAWMQANQQATNFIAAKPV
jgi:hypothetical protein